MIPGIDYTSIAVAFLCHDGQGNFAFHKRGPGARDLQGTWDCGGGKIEFGETPETALWREISEEYGCTGKNETYLRPHVLRQMRNF